MKIFHGGCHGCTNQDFFGLDECLGCQYYPVDGKCHWGRPNNFSAAEIRRVHDPDTGRYYALKSDEKLVHYKAGYERNINGEVFQPLHTRIVKNNDIYNVVWDSRDVVGNPVFNEDVPTDKPIVGYIKKFGLVDELQKETDEWLVGAV